MTQHKPLQAVDSTQETTLAPPPIEIPETVVRAILKDYAEDLIAEVNSMILSLNANISDGNVVMARRRALLDFKTIVHDHVSYSVRPWRFESQVSAAALRHQDTAGVEGGK